ncbi:MAG: ATP-binding protein, partial [Acidobacteriota bacterium]
AQIPTMVVQTLVENAIKHGVAAVRGPGKVEVRGYRDGKHIRIEVADNGPGFHPESPSTPSPESGKGTGYGLKNVRERLQGHFGKEAGLGISRDEEKKMTMVAVWLPFTHRSAAKQTSGASRQ